MSFTQASIYLILSLILKPSKQISTCTTESIVQGGMSPLEFTHFIMPSELFPNLYYTCGKRVSSPSGACLRFTYTKGVGGGLGLLSEIDTDAEVTDGILIKNGSSETLYIVHKDNPNSLSRTTFTSPSSTPPSIYTPLTFNPSFSYPEIQSATYNRDSDSPNYIFISNRNPVDLSENKLYRYDILLENLESYVYTHPMSNLRTGYVSGYITGVDTTKTHLAVSEYDQTINGSKVLIFHDIQWGSHDDKAFFEYGANDLNKFFGFRRINGLSVFMRVKTSGIVGILDEQILLDPKIRIQNLKSFPNSNYLAVRIQFDSRYGFLDFYQYNDDTGLVRVTFSGGNIFTNQYETRYSVEMKKMDTVYYLTLAGGVSNKAIIFEFRDPNPPHCHWTCATCDSFDNRLNACITCRDHWIHDPLAKTCTCNTADKLFILGGIECFPCSENCGTCSGTVDNCLSCPSGLGKILGAGSPTPCVCPNGSSLINPSPVCQSCNTGCRTCEAGVSICTNCLAPFLHEASNNTCYCPKGTLLVGSLCLPCSIGCKNCPTGVNICTDCLTNFLHNPSNNTCSCPPESHLLVNNQCLPLQESPDLKPNQSSNIILIESYFSKEDQSLKLILRQRVQVRDFNSFKLTLISESEEDSSSDTEFIINKSKLIDYNRTLIFYTNLTSLILNQRKIKIEVSQIEDNPQPFPQEKSFKIFLPLIIYPINYYETSMDDIFQGSLKQIEFSIKFSQAIAFLVSSNSLVTIMKLFQILDFLHLLDIEVPRNVEIFYSRMRGDFLDMIPNIFKKDEPHCILEDRIKRSELDCLFVNNVGPIITILISIFISKIVVYLLKLAFSIFKIFLKRNKKEKGYQALMILLIDQFLIYLASFSEQKMVVNLLVSLQIDVMIAVAITVKKKSKEILKIFLG